MQKVFTVYAAIECYKKQSFYVKNKQIIYKLTLINFFAVYSFCQNKFLFFHSHIRLRIDLFDKIIKNRCTCSFYRHFLCLQKLLAQSLPKQFADEC